MSHAMLAVTREQAAAYRIAQQHLATRLERKDLLAAAAGGIQDSPPGSALQRRIWRGTGSPGIGLADGAVVATWRPRSRGKLLTIDIEPLTALSPAIREAIVAEASSLGALRGVTAVETEFATG